MEEEDDSRNPSPSTPPPFWLHHHQHPSRPGRTWSGASNTSTTSSMGGYSSSSPLRPWVLILVLALVILFVIPHPLSSSGSHARAGGGGAFQYPAATARPASSVVKSGWGAVNAALVLFAIICGLLGRAGGDNQEAQQQHQRLDAAGRSLLEDSLPPSSTPQHLRVTAPPSVWYGYPTAQPVRGYAVPGPVPPAQPVEIGVPVPGTGMRLRRSSSSYPDLRQEHWVQANEWRFSDDLGIQRGTNNNSGGGGATSWQDSRDDFHLPQTALDRHSREHYAPAAAVGYRSTLVGSTRYDAATPEVTTPRPPRSPPAPPPPAPPPPPPPAPRDPSASTPIHVDRVRPRSPPPPPPTTTPTAPPPPRQPRRRRKPSRESFVDPDPEPQPVPPSPLLAPPAPPPPPLRRLQDESSTERAHKRRSSGAKDIATAIALFYQKRKKRSGGSAGAGGRGKTKSHDDSELQLSPERTHDDDATIADVPTMSTTPPPPPPPPPKSSSSLFQLFPNKRSSGKSKRVHSVPAAAAPISAPPPPPPPPPTAPAPDPSTPTHSRRTRRPPIPLRRPDGAEAINITYRRSDFTYGEKVFMPPPPPPPPSVPESPTGTPRSTGGPATEEDQDEQGGSARSTSERPTPFCPSPDVNSKAELFIARLRDGWRLEKLKSIKEKEQKCEMPHDGADAYAGDRGQRQS